jgi:hypothetical protein
MLASKVGPLFQRPAEASSATSGGAAKKPKFCTVDDDDFKDGQGEVQYFNFNNGTTLEFDLSKCNDEIRRLLAGHGAKQKIADSYAGVKGDYALGVSNAQDVMNTLYGGDWAQEREGGGPRLAELAEAISRIKGVDIEVCKKVVEAATPEERTSWRSNLTVKNEVAKMRAEKAAAALSAGGEQQPLNINLPR